MGAWSVEPFGNDVAADWAWDLEETSQWDVVEDALRDALEDAEVDHETAQIAVAAVEVIAHGLGRRTQCDAYTHEVEEFVVRAGRPPRDLVDLAAASLAAATGPASELSTAWADAGDVGWSEAITRLRASLTD
ncbi:hypothetical protein GCM10009808_25620 [Microbacterium sediminicola]|uniref:DUF4259 domain-containing protein n=1 Tax=Microbacterium sediminicola TaxID=415210 RepID=A0ABN2IK11_9MICO